MRNVPQATYKNAEALALQNMFSQSGGTGKKVTITLNSSEAATDEDKASMELALSLQREEAEAAAGHRVRQWVNTIDSSRRTKKGPLDNFLKPK